MPRIGQISAGSLASGAPVIVTPTGFTDGASTDVVTMPTGTTAQRPGTPAEGTLRYNTDTESLEFWDGSQWRAVIGAHPFAQVRRGAGSISIPSTGGYLTMEVNEWMPSWFTRIDGKTFRITQTGTYFVSIFGILRATNRNKWDCVIELRDVTTPGSPVVLVKARQGVDTQNSVSGGTVTSYLMATIIAPSASIDLSVWVDPLGASDLIEVSTSMFSQGMTVRRLR